MKDMNAYGGWITPLERVGTSKMSGEGCHLKSTTVTR